MNWKVLFYVSTAFWLSALLLTQCTQQVDSSAIDGELLPALAVEGIFKPVLCGDNPSPECLKIQQQMRAYEAAIDSLSKVVPDWEPIHTDQPTIPELIREMYTLRGYRYKIEELEKLLYQADKGNDEYLYLMFAVNDELSSLHHRDSLGSPIRFLDAYFQVETEEGLITYKSSSAGIALDKAYTDFPSPCPTACPPPDTSHAPPAIR
jgi:hypothetical protein